MIGILKGKQLMAFLNPNDVVICRKKFLIEGIMACMNVSSRREGYYTTEVTSLSKNAFTQSN